MAAPSSHVVDAPSSNVPFLGRTFQRESIRNIPVILVTARKDQESKREVLSAGAVDDTHPV
jgi:CheY-like chemotaxis protein